MSEFSAKNQGELMKLLEDKRKALQAFRFGMSGSKTKNVKEGKNLRTEIAQIMTELTKLKKA